MPPSGFRMRRPETSCPRSRPVALSSCSRRRFRSSNSAHELVERRLIAALHRRLDVECELIATERDDRLYLAAVAIDHVRVARIEVADDHGRVELLGVADVAERHVVMLAPEERDIVAGALAKH